MSALVFATPVLLASIGAGQAFAAMPAAGTVISSTASASYVPGGYTQIETSHSNTTNIVVAAVEALQLTQDLNVTRPAGAQFTLTHLLTNMGNVSSSYTLNLANNAAGCAADSFDFGALSLVRDLNNNGVVDANEAAIVLGSPGALTLAPGQSAMLLVRGTVPSAVSGSACLGVSAISALQGQSAINRDVVTISNAAVLSLNKSAVVRGFIVPGQSQIDYTIAVANVGAQDAQPTGSMLPGPVSLSVNGSPNSLVIIRDLVPAGTSYVAGTLQSTAAGAIKLFRLPGDAPYNYRAGNGADDASAIEVAIGLPTALVRNGSAVMQFSAMVRADATADIRNNAQSYYNDGAQTAVAGSNTVLIPLAPSRIGIAKSASVSKPNLSAGGVADGTANVTFNLRFKNYGTTTLYDVQAVDLIQGSANSSLGTYTSATVPGSGQYTIVAGSVAIVSTAGSVGGTVVAANNAFTGAPSASNLLAPGAVLPPGAEAIVQFTARFNLLGRPATLYNSARAQASMLAGAAPSIFDDSTNGANPDPDGDGNPNNNAEPTPIVTQLPVLTLAKTASLPRRVAQGVHDIDFTFSVSNTGVSDAPNVRIIDNFECALETDKSTSVVASWQLVGAVRSVNKVLNPGSGFTGSARCDRTRQDSANAFDFPTEVALSLTDGTRSLAPGQSEQLVVTVRITEKTGATDARATFTNKAWASAFDQNTVNPNPAGVVASSVATTSFILIDPQGTVYDSDSRNPIAGAVVNLRRTACAAGAVTPITSAEIFSGDSGLYTYNTDGSVSMTTASDGGWQFFLNSPPVSSVCTYAITATPPAGSGYVYPSALIPPASGKFAQCGAMVPSATPPLSSDATTYQLSFDAGLKSDGSVCDVIHIHIPMDPGLLNGLVLRKDASKRQVEFGDFLEYALTLTNKTGFPVTGVSFSDTLPPGLAYVPNSSRLNGVATSNPDGAAGPTLTWNFPSVAMAADQMVMVRFRVRVGVGAQIGGTVINRATARTHDKVSNEATASVRVDGGVFSDEAFAIGKVFMDCKRDGQQQGEDEPGVPGVRLYMEDGTFVVTDSQGKWSLYGLKPVTHVLRLDETTLPPGAQVMLLDNRNSAEPSSRFMDLKKGELHKANFPLSGCEVPAVMEDVQARRKVALEQAGGEGELAVRNRLDPQQRTVVTSSNSRGMPASGVVSGNAAQLERPAQVLDGRPLIELLKPASNSNTAAAFVNGTGAAGSLTGTLNTAQSTTGGFASLQPGLATPSSLVGKSGMVAAQPSPPAGSLSLASGALRQVTSAPSPIELEKVLPDLDSKPGFIELKNADTVASQSINVRVKGPLGAVLRLSVNSVALDARRVGKKATLERTNTAAWEYIGVLLQPGANVLRLDVVDEFGNAREVPVEISVIAPDKLGAIHIELPANARADGRTPIPVTVRLTDAAGVAITARTQLTLEADAGRWVETDLNPSEPGTQVFMDGGQAVFNLIPPETPGDIRVRASTGDFAREVRLALLPDLRPLLGVGIVEGTLDLTRRGKLTLGDMPAGAAFEQELRSLSSKDNGARVGARTAFFFKGAIAGEYLLTAALDTDKDPKSRLFRDIRPDEFYPVYGDSSGRGFDAQSSQRLYVRIDKDRSYLLYGDFTTSSSSEVRKLSQVNRSLTGLKNVYQTDDMRVTSYAARTSQTKQVEEFRGGGISGPYYLAGSSGDFVTNSELVEVLVRDRNQPNVVLQTLAMTRFVDYTIEPLSRRILFTRPISSIDSNLNPQSIRVSYEVDSGGPKYTTAGTDAQFKVGDNTQLGVVLNTDRNPEKPRDLAAVTALVSLGESTSAAAEYVATKSAEKGTGSASRIEIRHQDGDLTASAQAARSSAGFDNPDAGFAAARQEANARMDYRLGKDTALRGELIYSKDALTKGTTRGVTASVQQVLGAYFTAEAGFRYGVTSTGSASLFDYNQVSSYNNSFGSSNTASSVTMLGSAVNTTNTSASTSSDQTTVRGRLTAKIPALPSTQVFVEGEQDLQDGGKRMVAIGGNYAITDKTRLYGRYELVSSLGGISTLSSTSARNTGVLGVESNYMEGGRVFNEYRLTDTMDGRTGQAAVGIRNTFKLNDQWRVTAGAEHTRAMGGGASGSGSSASSVIGLGNSVALTSGAEYTSERIRFSGVLEGRDASDSRTILTSAGLGYKVDDDWSVLARSVYSSSKGSGASEGDSRVLSRQQIGLAYRPVDQDVWNALARYEHKVERISGAGTTLGTISGNAFGSDASLPGNYKADIVSLHLNYNPRPGLVVNGRFAAKRSVYDDGQLASSYSAQLLQGRVTYDINKDWDIGVQAGLLRGSGGALRKTFGVELGYQVYRNLWLSGGYNFVGLSDRDLTAGEYTSKGAYIRLRFKFDERTLGFTSPSTGQSATTRVNSSGASMPNLIEVPAVTTEQD